MSNIKVPKGGSHGEFLMWDGRNNEPCWVMDSHLKDHTKDINDIKDRLSNLYKDIDDNLIVLVEGAVNRHLNERKND